MQAHIWYFEPIFSENKALLPGVFFIELKCSLLKEILMIECHLPLLVRY
jgi:hypothetical protein